jgi:hypothetical protein
MMTNTTTQRTLAVFGWWGRVRYRLLQFVRGFSAAVSEQEAQQAQAILPCEAWPLFQRMPRDAQRHSLNVLATLRAAGQTDQDLAAAALLHDVGKVAAADAGYRLTLWWRGPLVLIEALAPDWLRHWSAPTPSAGWRYVLYVHQEHPAIGATWAEAAGCSPRTCWLIAHHQERNPALQGEEELQLLRALQWADSEN